MIPIPGMHISRKVAFSYLWDECHAFLILKVKWMKIFWYSVFYICIIKSSREPNPPPRHAPSSVQACITFGTELMSLCARRQACGFVWAEVKTILVIDLRTKEKYLMPILHHTWTKTSTTLQADGRRRREIWLFHYKGNKTSISFLVYIRAVLMNAALLGDSMARALCRGCILVFKAWKRWTAVTFIKPMERF